MRFTIALILSLGLNSNVWAEGNKVNEVNGTNNTKKNKTFETITIYSGSNATSVASSFAHNFGEESSSFRGKRISGDDLFLNTALAKDPLGVSFNALPNIFDLESRHIKDNLSLVNVRHILRKPVVSEVAIEKVGISVNNADDEVNKFLDWVLAQGTKYNHEFGLLNLK